MCTEPYSLHVSVSLQYMRLVQRASVSPVFTKLRQLKGTVLGNPQGAAIDTSYYIQTQQNSGGFQQHPTGLTNRPGCESGKTAPRPELTPSSVSTQLRVCAPPQL